MAGMGGSVCARLPFPRIVLTGQVCYWYHAALQLFYAVEGYEAKLSSNCAKAELLVEYASGNGH